MPASGHIEMHRVLRQLGRIVSLAFRAMPAIVPAVAVCAYAADDNSASSETIVFHIPSQPLAAALEAFSVTARREVIYNGRLVIGRQSAAVQGTFTPEAALQQLLEGSRLTPRYMAADAFVLMPTPADRVRLPVNTASAFSVVQYYGLIQARLRQIFCADNRTQPGNYRVAASFWIDADGRVSHTLLLGTTGARDLDVRIDRALHTLAVGAAPPSGFAQPVTLVVSPQSPEIGRDCQIAGAMQPSLGGVP